MAFVTGHTTQRGTLMDLAAEHTLPKGHGGGLGHTASALAHRYACVALLKGAGTLIAADWQFHPLRTSLGVLAVIGLAAPDVLDDLLLGFIQDPHPDTRMPLGEAIGYSADGDSLFVGSEQAPTPMIRFDRIQP